MHVTTSTSTARGAAGGSSVDATCACRKCRLLIVSDQSGSDTLVCCRISVSNPSMAAHVLQSGAHAVSLRRGHSVVHRAIPLVRFHLRTSRQTSRRLNMSGRRGDVDWHSVRECAVFNVKRSVVGLQGLGRALCLRQHQTIRLLMMRWYGSTSIRRRRHGYQQWRRHAC